MKVLKIHLLGNIEKGISNLEKKCFWDDKDEIFIRQKSSNVIIENFMKAVEWIGFFLTSPTDWNINEIEVVDEGIQYNFAGQPMMEG